MKKLIVTIITIGDELLIGQTIDTNSAWMAQQLNEIGLWVQRRVAIGDDREDILSTLLGESQTADILLITGGLGPTNDDITKAVLCEYFGSSLIENREVLDAVRQRYASFGRPMPQSNIQQALVPDNCTVLANQLGTAPGMWFEREGKVYVSMPGVPHEMQGIMIHEVLPRLKRNFVLPEILHRTLITMGQGESEVAAQLADFEKSLPAHIKLAYLPGAGMLKLRLTAFGEEAQRLGAEMDQYFSVMKETLPVITVADEDIPLESLVGKLLNQRHLSLCTAESCTGGYIAHRITSVSGSSAYFKGSIVSYADMVKNKVLKVPESILETYGAVSEPTVKAMAEGALKLLDTDLAIAVSGIMGPNGGTPEKPVGTVWIAVAFRQDMQANKTAIRTKKFKVRYDRLNNIRITANYALNMLKEAIDRQILSA